MSFPAYDDYKHSGVEWLGELPMHWDTSRLSFEADVIAGYPFDASLFGFDGIPVVRMSDFGGGKVDTEDAKRVAEANVPESSLAQPGDVLLGLSGSISNFAIVAESDIPIAINQRVAVVRAAKSKRDLILWFLQSPEFLNQLVADLPSTTILNISMGDLCKCRIPVPTEDEQKAISSFLDVETSKIDGLVSEQRRLIELLKEKRQAVISHAVTKGLNPNAPMKPSGIQWLGDVPQHWESSPLKFISSLKGRLGWQGLRAEDYTETGPYLVTSVHFVNDRIDWEQCHHVPVERYEMAPEIQLRPDDLLMMKDGAAMGKLAYVDELPGPACLNSHLLLFRPTTGQFLNRFLYYVLTTSYFEAFMVVNRTGTTFFGISQESIGKFQCCRMM